MMTTTTKTLTNILNCRRCHLIFLLLFGLCLISYLTCMAFVLMPLSSSNIQQVNIDDKKQQNSFQHRKLKNLVINEFIKNQLSLSSNNNDDNEDGYTKNDNPFQSNTTLNDIFISVKTTRIFHKSRLDIILDTWYQLAKNQTYFFSDAYEESYRSKLGDHLVNTNCSVSHNRKALCCKMSVEFDYFIESNKNWWCHFDDDNYVNIPRLVNLLKQFNPLFDWYLGKTSIKKPLEIEDRDTKKKIHFSFATGGAGFCVSKALALKMISVASNGKLISVGDRIRLPDDVTIGYIIEYMLKKKLTVIKEFHSHLEPLAMLEKNKLKDQISLSYSGNKINRNVLSLNQIESIPNDSTRFYSLHCFLFPNFCNILQHQKHKTQL